MDLDLASCVRTFCNNPPTRLVEITTDVFEGTVAVCDEHADRVVRGADYHVRRLDQSYEHEAAFETYAWTCSRCHKRYDDQGAAIRCFDSHDSPLNDLAEFVPYSRHVYEVVRQIAAADGYDDWEVSDDTPFMSEAVLYQLLGKDDARTVLAYLHKALRRERGEL